MYKATIVIPNINGKGWLKDSIESDDLKLVARALLPAEILEGSKLKYELMQYELIG